MDKDLLNRINHKSIFPIVEETDVNAFQILRSEEERNALSATAPLCKEDIKQLKEEGYEFPNEWQENQTILIRNPFRPYEFVSYDKDKDYVEYIKAHLLDIATVFRALGAISCDVSARIVSKYEIAIKGKGRLRVKTIKTKGRFRYKLFTVNDSSVRLKIDNMPSTKSYEEKYKNAQEYAQKYHIENVPAIKDILKAFDPLAGRPKKYIYNEDLTTELHKVIEGAIKVTALGAFDFKGELKATTISYNNLHIEKEIIFE